jgi:hypothetical protein
MNKNTLLIIASILTLGSVAAFIGYRNYTKSFSPEAEATFQQNGFKIGITFCQPAKKGRLLFGREQDKALVPYNKVWRTGANEATVFTLTKNVQIAGTPIQAGTYSLWTIPGPGNWQVVINQESGQWGTEYNDGKDLARIEVPIRIKTPVTENFTIYFEEKENGANMILSWDQTEAVIPITADNFE